MKFSILGSGSVKGAPVYGCDCPACLRARQHPQYQRKPCSALIELQGFRVLIDAGLEDLTQRFPPGSLDAILLTHYHMDHVHGLFPLRWGCGVSIPVIGPDDKAGCDDLFKHPGILNFEQKARPFQRFTLGPLTITPIPLKHSKLTHGYLIEATGQRIAYLTDSCGLSERSLHTLQQWQAQTLILDCSFPPQNEQPRGHNDLNMALAIHANSGATRTWLTHIGHELDVWLQTHAATLPDNIQIAYDDMPLPPLP